MLSVVINALPKDEDISRMSLVIEPEQRALIEKQVETMKKKTGYSVSMSDVARKALSIGLAKMNQDES